MIDKILTILSALAAPLGKFLSFLVGIFKKPLVEVEEQIKQDNQSAKDHFEETGRPK